MSLQNQRGNVFNAFPGFFQFKEMDVNSHCFVQIFSDRDNYQVWTKNLTLLAQRETGNKSRTWTDTFCHDDEIVFQLAHVPFKDSPGECYFVPKKDSKHHSGCQALIDFTGQFLGINTT